MFENAHWIGLAQEPGEIYPEFFREFAAEDGITSARLYVTVIGVYELSLNGERIGDAVLAPGCTAFESRLLYQEYDITELLGRQNRLGILVGKGWHRGRISDNSPEVHNMPCAVILQLDITYQDGHVQQLVSDANFRAQTSRISASDLYDGESYDASLESFAPLTVTELSLSKSRLTPQDGEWIKEHERIAPVRILTTPKGETVIDFGQNFAGYPEITLTARRGERVCLSCAETLDRDGNFYTENYRSAKARLEYTCRGGEQTYKPHFTIYGFRYLRVDEFPGTPACEYFTGIAVYSDIRRRGYLTSGNALLNRLYENTLWSQRANFIDIPTDCPQRDERMGWTGDAQVFARTAGYNYDVYRFFSKWLADVRAQQRADGSIPDTVPNFWQLKTSSAAWGDVICIVPWEMYRLFGKREILEENFDAMCRWVDYITTDTTTQDLWICDEKQKGLWQKHYGDWLALDAPAGSYKGSTDDDRIASAFYDYSCSLVIKAGHVLGREVGAYEALEARIADAYRKRYEECTTQTDYVLALHFGLTTDAERDATRLAEQIRTAGGLQTGFVGTPYLLHALSENGYTELAYDLLLNEKYPSWFYEVRRGATTIWEHWDGVNDKGAFWSKDMNSFNHYAYGSVMDWVYGVAAGIRPDEEAPGFARAVIAPHPDRRLGFLDARLETSHGVLLSKWSYRDNTVRYEITTPVPARLCIAGETHEVDAGSYVLETDAAF